MSKNISNLAKNDPIRAKRFRRQYHRQQLVRQDYTLGGK